MPRACSTCQSEHLEAINRELAANTAIPAIAALYRVSTDSLLRHKANHLPAAIAKAHAATEVSRGDELLGEVNRLKGKAISLLLKAEVAGDYRTALAGIREARSCLELLLEVEGEIDRAPVVNIVLSSEWIALRGRLMHALQPFPEARLAVARQIEAGDEYRD